MKERMITGIVMAILFLIPFYFGGQWFTTLTLVLALIAYLNLRQWCKSELLELSGLRECWGYSSYSYLYS